MQIFIWSFDRRIVRLLGLFIIFLLIQHGKNLQGKDQHRQHAIRHRPWTWSSMNTVASAQWQTNIVLSRYVSKTKSLGDASLTRVGYTKTDRYSAQFMRMPLLSIQMVLLYVRTVIPTIPISVISLIVTQWEPYDNLFIINFAFTFHLFVPLW